MLKNASPLVWRSSVKPALLRSVLLRGSILAGAGVCLLLIGGTLLPAHFLKLWGFPILIVAFVFITLGLLPYRRLTQLEMRPDELHYDGDSLLFVRKKRAVLRIPLTAVASLSYREVAPLYGLCVKLKASPPEKVAVLHPRFNLEQVIHESCAQECDLFLPYFSARSCEELKECF